MTPSRVFVGVGFGVLGLAVGGLLVSMLKTSTIVPFGADDSPVTVRGGSLGGYSDSQWTDGSSANPPYYSTTVPSLSKVSMDGVEPISLDKPSGTPEQVNVSFSSNWTMTLSFRKAAGDDSEEKAYKLELCSSYPCSTTGAISGSTLYLVDAGSSPGAFSLDKYDNRNRLDYHVKNCNGMADAKDSHCNHIKNISVSGSGVTIKDASGIPVNVTSFLCRAGACDIGFDTTTGK